MYLEKLGAIKSQAILQMEKENKKEESGGLIRDILKKLTWSHSLLFRLHPFYMHSVYLWGVYICVVLCIF